MPTSTSRAPDCSMTSGMRNPPPISTLSPRDTATSRPCASAARTSMTAAALLFTTMADSALMSDDTSAETAVCREPRSPVVRSNSILLGREALLWANGARPRLVCNNTPVALTTSVSSAECSSCANCSAVAIASVGDCATARRAQSTKRECGRELV